MLLGQVFLCINLITNHQHCSFMLYCNMDIMSTCTAGTICLTYLPLVVLSWAADVKNSMHRAVNKSCEYIESHFTSFPVGSLICYTKRISKMVIVTDFKSSGLPHPKIVFCKKIETLSVKYYCSNKSFSLSK